MTGRLAYHKVLGIKNPADILAKLVPAALSKYWWSPEEVVRRTRPELNILVLVVTAWDASEDWEQADVRSPETTKEHTSACGCCTARFRRLTKAESVTGEHEQKFKDVRRQPQSEFFRPFQS